jgi:hypothetical protein
LKTFIRIRDPASSPHQVQGVEGVSSVKRGTLYDAEKLGLLRGVLFRCETKKSGVKLWDMRSIENWIRGVMEKP